MAIVFPDYLMMMRLKGRGHIMTGSTLMEIGKQNWCDDVPLDKLIADTADQTTTKKLRAIHKKDPNSFKIVDHYYRNVLGVSDYKSIDPGVADSDYKYDLNYALPWGCGDDVGVATGQFDIVTNSGTGEHIFNQAQLFQSVHELTKPGGIMTHALPWTGWYNHGFYNFQPTVLYDLAAANGYTVLDMVLGGAGVAAVFDMNGKERWDYLITELATSPDGTFMFDGMKVRLHHTVIAAALRKGTKETSFKIPNQGAYAKDIKKPAKKVRINMDKRLHQKLFKGKQ